MGAFTVSFSCIISVEFIVSVWSVYIIQGLGSSLTLFRTKNMVQSMIDQQSDQFLELIVKQCSGQSYESLSCKLAQSTMEKQWIECINNFM